MGLLDNLFGTPTYGGLLGEQDQKAARQQAMLALTSGLLEAGGPSPVPISTGQAIGRGLQAANVGQNASIENSLKAALLRKQMEPRPVAPPDSVQEYQFAKQSGFTGSFEQWKALANQGNKPRQGMGLGNINPGDYTPESFSEFVKTYDPQTGMGDTAILKRYAAPPQPFLINDASGTRVIAPTRDGGIGGQTELTTPEQKRADAAALKEAETRGQMSGEAWGAMAKKGINALNVLESLDLADPLIDVATGSGAGAARDKIAAFFGESTTGDQAIAQLKIIQANLMTNMPRMEGPQSDRDVQLYKEAAGELGDPNIPRARKKAALRMIQALQQRYADNAPGADSDPLGIR